MKQYRAPDMQVYEQDLLAQYEAFASSSPSCTSAAVAVCVSSAVHVCTANSKGCGKASYCTTKSS